jgi:predicted AlkP superfamily pyrophosphatase or phosphodiesterase
VLILVDGVSADTFARQRARLPHLASLTERGLVVERLGSVTPGTSLPGRVAMLTGTPCSSHGVWGNVIWDGTRFRYANPDDVLDPTLAARAVAAGLDVAVLGYGMIRPEDASVFHHAWWANEMLQRARDEAPIPADEGWLRTSRHQDASGRLAALHARGFPEAVPNAYAEGALHYFASELAGDEAMLAWTAGLLTEARPPDLVLTEILTPDTVQHRSGYGSLFAHWAISYADALIGSLLERLRRAGRLGEVTLAVMSDHGHAPVTQALHPDVIVPGARHQCEGAFLHVAPENRADLERITARLAAHGAARLPGDHLPPEVRGTVVAFVAPDGSSFEPWRGEDGEKPRPAGPPRYLSSHGFRPGHPGDDRFAVFAGPGVPEGSLASAGPLAVAPTLAGLLGLPLTPYPARPLF